MFRTIANVSSQPVKSDDILMWAKNAQMLKINILSAMLPAKISAFVKLALPKVSVIMLTSKTGLRDKYK